MPEIKTKNWSPFVAGKQASLNNELAVPIPKSIRATRDKNMRERATVAWRAVVRLRHVLQLWEFFKMLGSLGERLNRNTETKVGKLYPSLKDMGCVRSSFFAKVVAGLAWGESVRSGGINRDRTQVHERPNICRTTAAAWSQTHRASRRILATAYERRHCVASGGRQVRTV